MRCKSVLGEIMQKSHKGLLCLDMCGVCMCQKLGNVCQNSSGVTLRQLFLSGKVHNTRYLRGVNIRAIWVKGLIRRVKNIIFTRKINVSAQWISEFYRSKTKSCVRRCPPGMLIKDFFSRERIGVFERKQQKRRKTALLMKRPDNFHPWFLSQVRNTGNETWSVPLSYTLLWGCCKFQPQ